MMNLLRPLSPHLPIYKPQLTSTFPISHRIFGAFLATIVLFFYLLYLKMGLICFTYYTFYQIFFYTAQPILIPAVITAFFFSYYLYNGVRVWHFYYKLNPIFFFNQPEIIFSLIILFMILSFSLVSLFHFLLYPEKKEIVKVILVMGGASAIFFCFRAKTEVSRILSLLSFFFSSFTTLVILHKPVETLIFSLFLFCIVFSFFPLDFVFVVIIIGRIWISPEMSEWGIALVVQLFFIYLFFFFEKKEQQSSATPKKPIFFSLIFILILLFLEGFFYFKDPICQYKILFLLAGASVIYFIFLSTIGLGQLISFVFYFLINIIIGVVLTPSERTLFYIPEITIIFLLFNGFLFFFFILTSFVSDQKVSQVIFEEKKKVGVFYFLILNTLLERLNPPYLWMSVWLDGLVYQIGALSLLFFFFKTESTEFFGFLEKKK